jgi:hypothetical protein
MTRLSEMTEARQALWTDPAWLAEVNDWLKAALRQQGMEMTAAPEQIHIQPWSTVLRVSTDAGNVYFKATAPGLAQETAITQALYQWQPDCIPQVLHTDTGRGWMLLADGGQRLRERFKAGLAMSAWMEILAEYADLQIGLAGHVDELLALGARDRRLSLLPALYQALLADTEWLLLDQPDGLTSSEYQRLLRAGPQVSALCERLAAYAIPESLHHNDLHDGNIFIKNGRTLFFDWGDSSIAHPFFSLRTVFVSIENSFGLEEDDPIFAEYAQAYLRPWTKYESEANLVEAYQIARRLWAISSAIKYKTFMSLIEAARKENAMAVPALLQELLAANPTW